MNEVKNKKRKKRKINRILTIILLVTVLIFFITVLYLNIIPIIYIILALVVIILMVFGISILNFSRKRILRLIGYLLTIILAFILIFGEIYLINTLGFLFSTTSGNYSLKNYNILVLDNKFNELEDLDNKKIGIHTSDTSIDKIKNKLNKKIDVKYKTYDDSKTLVEGLLNEEVVAIILGDSEIELLKEENITTYEGLKNIYQFEIKQDIKNLIDAVNINKEPFNVYISGIDTYGKINSSSRSDVNIVLTVNPKTEKILITWIPRDYYVSINESKYKDKLTHAGIYGIDSSIYAIEKLLDIDINYYVKVNFTSVIEIVDLLGGVTVYNDETFQIENGNVYKKGKITLNGEQTLEFVRERKNVTGGDLGRGRNQIKVLEALMNKAMSKSIIKSYTKLLKSLEDAFVTNMSQSTMASFIKKELSSPRNWQIESNTLTGTDSYEYTYTYKNSALYAMKPDKESISNAKEKINKLINK